MGGGGGGGYANTMPQRSIIDPILVIIYVNDLCNVSQVVQFILLQMTAIYFIWR